MSDLKAISAIRNYPGITEIFTLNVNRWRTSDFVLKAAYLCLQMVDLALTVTAARCGFPELNPLMRASLASFSDLTLFKCLLPILIAWLVPGRLLVPGIVLLCGIIGWNVKELLLCF